MTFRNVGCETCFRVLCETFRNVHYKEPKWKRTRQLIFGSRKKQNVVLSTSGLAPSYSSFYPTSFHKKGNNYCRELYATPSIKKKFWEDLMASIFLRRFQYICTV